jgi:single-strand DNA-binding protein
VGNLSRDPELRKTQTDVSVCTFTVACNRRFTNANGEREADFLPVVVWRGQADNCYRYLKKGNRVAVSGTIQTRSYEDKDGNRRYITEIVADEVEFLTAKKGEDSEPAAVSDMTPVDMDEPWPF